MARKHPRIWRVLSLGMRRRRGLTDGFEESNQYHSANERDDKTSNVEASDSTTESEEVKDPAPEDGTHDTHDDVEDNALLCIRAHEH